MRPTIRWLLPVLLGATGVFMLFAPDVFYARVPGVTETGPMNHHFVRDIGSAYLASAAGLGWWAADPRRGLGGAFAAAVFLGLHMLVHVFDAFSGGHGVADVGRDFVGVYLPALIVIWITWRGWAAREV